MFEIESAFLLTTILCLGMFIQSAVGFAAGLFAIPIMLWSGFSIPEAQCALMVASIPQNAAGIWVLRDELPIKKSIWPAVGRFLLYPVGVYVLWSMESLPVVTIRQIVGAIVLTATAAILFVKPTPRESLHPIWGLLAFPLSGFINGWVGIGGPIMVLWVQAHDWSTQQSRGFLFIQFLVTIVPALAILYWVFGSPIVGVGILAIAIIPLLLIATFAGLRVGTWLGRDRLRRVTYALLMVIGASGLASPWLAP